MSSPADAPLVAPVVVGVDGSAACLPAADSAVWEATVRRRPLRLVHAFIWPYLHAPLGPSPYGPPEGGLRHEAERVVADAYARVISRPCRAPDVVEGGLRGVVVAAA